MYVFEDFIYLVLFKIRKMKKILVLLYLFIANLVSAQDATDSIKKTIEPAKIEQVTIAPCDVNRTSMKFEIDTLSMTVRISAIEALALYKNNELKQADLRMPVVYSLEEKEITDGMRINLQQIKIGSLLLTNVDALVVKDQATSIILGKNILSKTGIISIVNNDFKFSNLVEPYVPIKIDMTNDEFNVSKRAMLVEQANKSIRANLVSNLKRYVRTNEKDEEKDLRVLLTFKVELDSFSKNDEKYAEELAVNQKTVTGKMMYDTFRLINTSVDTKETLEFYDTTSFNIVFIYIDKTIKFKHVLTRENLKKLAVPYTKEEFLQALSITEKTKK
jgi:gag-polyprotein putative aspartyl protease